MTILKDFSILWSLIHTLILFMLLFESRFSRKKTLILTLSTMIPLIVLNFALFLIFGADKYSTLMLFTCSLPSLIFFLLIAKHRDGRFFFTFCMVDTVMIEITYITSIIEHYIPGERYIFIFVSRLVIYPILEWLTYKKLRPIYFDVQNHTKKGWYILTAIGAVFYVAISLSAGYPTLITERPEDLPVLILMFILMPVVYINIFNTLRHQQNMYEIKEQDNILRVQVANMANRIDELFAADDKFRMERHNLRHKMQTIANLVEKEQYDELHNLVLEYSEAAKETQVKRYCTNAVIDAVLSTYLHKAESENIKVSTKIILPDPLSVSEAELATVFANAVENAINACEKVDKTKRYIDIRVLTTPRFMIQVRNSFNGRIEFDKNGIPVNRSEGHGFGTRSIVAFCEKHNAFYEFKADDENFSLRIMLE